MISVSLSHNDVCEHQMKHFQENLCDLLFDMLKIAVLYVNDTLRSNSKEIYLECHLNIEWGKMQ